MRKGLFLAGIFALLVLAPALAAQNCRITSVDPMNGRAGDTIGATGESIDASKVEELYLTDGTNDIRVEMIEQTETLIKFKIPANVKPGRYSLMIKTKGPEPKLLEQPVKLTVET